MSAGADILGTESVSIGELTISGRALLAPMSGVTDVGMRRVAMRFGASAVISEMVASDDYVRGAEESRLRAEGEGVTPHIVQIAGCEPYWMGEAARLAEASGAAAVDINMGCPAKRVTGGYAGSALMRDTSLALRLIEATVGAVRIPVTLKMRLGWDAATLNAPDLARQAQAAGIKLVTVHGRTRQQFYKGSADWGAIARVREAITIPLVANGDCDGPEAAQAMLSASGADAVMIGRAAVGRPWLVGEIAGALAGQAATPIGLAPRKQAAIEHLETLLGCMGAHAGLRHARKHLSAYAQFAGAPEDLRLRLVTSDDPRQAKSLLEAAFSENSLSQAA
ncbi:tRNA dihydrouridine synthase DusB [Roseiarcaceae bacterium H3SJ34-1]|uniref:tRNA dihydrouridine synthase DusB n=1 Tax=Terripilifer ovatus TaxID=3032367 RepID=UPI003AB96A34|nr:tRNA dihydrouridine synthase DusB [Roseiarcaceae bacterium H3SJ34-1]